MNLVVGNGYDLGEIIDSEIWSDLEDYGYNLTVGNFTRDNRITFEVLVAQGIITTRPTDGFLPVPWIPRKVDVVLGGHTFEGCFFRTIPAKFVDLLECDLIEFVIYKERNS